MHDCALQSKASHNDPPVITNLESPSDTIYGRNVKSTYQLCLLVTYQTSTRLASILFVLHSVTDVRITISLDAWISQKSDEYIRLYLAIANDLLVPGRSAWIILVSVDYNFKFGK